MNRWHIDYLPAFQPGPMTFWVHRAVGTHAWYQAGAFDPPLPPAVPGQGFPVFVVETSGMVFRFASLYELDTAIAVLGQRHLPSTDRDDAERRAGPNTHWLNRLPPAIMRWERRQRVVRVLERARAAFAAGETAGP